MNAWGAAYWLRRVVFMIIVMQINKERTGSACMLNLVYEQTLNSKQAGWEIAFEYAKSEAEQPSTKNQLNGTIRSYIRERERERERNKYRVSF